MTKMDTSGIAAEWVPLSALKPWQNNPRVNDAAVDKVAESIRRFGWGSPILARKADGEVIAGHSRLKAAEKLGLDRVPVRYLDLDPADAHLLALADNKVGELAEWDEEMLGAVLADLKAQEIDLTVGTGFAEGEIDRLIDGTHGIGETGGEPDKDGYKELYGVIVTCRDERHQQQVYEELAARGYECKVVTT
jgi:site-specific DNA-methyltransferase (adenine-specific)